MLALWRSELYHQLVGVIVSWCSNLAAGPYSAACIAQLGSSVILARLVAVVPVQV